MRIIGTKLVGLCVITKAIKWHFKYLLVLPKDISISRVSLVDLSGFLLSLNSSSRHVFHFYVFMAHQFPYPKILILGLSGNTKLLSHTGIVSCNNCQLHSIFLLSIYQFHRGYVPGNSIQTSCF